jgi:enterochelin esterase-like enzyme
MRRSRPGRGRPGRLAALSVVPLLLIAACVPSSETSTPTLVPATSAPIGAAQPTATAILRSTLVPVPTNTPGPQVLPTRPAAVSTPDRRAVGSTIVEQVFSSPALGQNMSYLIYLPAGYENGDRRYPTLYLLHGVAGDSTEWPSIGVPAAADRLTRDGAIQPMIVVFPYGDAGYYVNNASGGLRWQDHLVEDVVASVDQTYRTLTRPESRAVGGLSMGGDGALQLTMRFPEMFGVAGAHSPSSRLLFEHVPADVYGSEAYFRAHNPFWLAQDVAGAERIKIWIDVGDDDPWRWNATAIHAALDARGIVHEFHMPPGTHEGDYWVAHLDDYLGFYSRSLAGP